MEGRTALLLVFISAIIAGLFGGLLGGFLFARTGPQGERGVQGVQGEQGVGGLAGQQGLPGLDGSNSVIQVIQSQNLTYANLDAYTDGQWYNMSILDSSMRLTINVQDQSRIYAEFLTSVSIPSKGTISLMIVVDNQFNGSVCNVGITNVPSLTVTFPLQARILTNVLPAGQHTIEVQFLRNDGTPLLLERSLYVSELASP